MLRERASLYSKRVCKVFLVLVVPVSLFSCDLICHLLVVCRIICLDTWLMLRDVLVVMTMVVFTQGTCTRIRACPVLLLQILFVFAIPWLLPF